MKIGIIGAGLGGLTAACLLSAKGHEVTVFEKNKTVGGKMNQVSAGSYRFDTGPSLLTMPFVLERVFKACDTNLDDYLTLLPLSPICRYQYADGTRFDNFDDLEQTLDQVRQIAPQDVEPYTRFLAYASQLYSKTADAFIFNPLFDKTDLKSLDLLSFFGIDAFSTVSKRIDTMFSSSYLRQFFKRFATYNGSSPYRAPATLNVIPHVEISQGGFYVDGGLYQVAEALYQLAGSLDVSFVFDAEVEHIEINQGQATGIHTSKQGYTPCDVIVSNSDATETTVKLIPDHAISASKKRKANDIEPSCSGFVLLLGINRTYEQLVHHNIFFSGDYKQEFKAIFDDRVMPEDPTIYIANTSFTNPEHATEGGSNLFILINAPYQSPSYNWQEQAITYGDLVIEQLESRGLDNLKASIEYRSHITPDDFYDMYRSNKGSIYGTSSNSRFSAFVRPRNKSRSIQGLYLVGGSTHPGGGIPLAIQSGVNAVELIHRYETDHK
ncbi:MAG: phytoene desaturase family protein [Bacteroidota bacterium]